MNLENKQRIEALDSFRAIAIFLVIFFHYFSHFSTITDLYPYDNKYSNLIITRYGYLGVEFFFIISGFVITLTLEKSVSLIEFLIKRFIRLFPTILVCSILTFTLVKVIDINNNFPHFHRTALGFIPSLTFTDLFIWNKIGGGKQLGYIDGSYWSLAIEAKFYLLGGIIFFYKRNQFLENWIKWSLLVMTVYYLLFFYTTYITPNRTLIFLKNAIYQLLFVKFVTYFTLGILFYQFFTKKKPKTIYLLTTTACTLAICFTFLNDNTERLFTLIFVFLFFAFLFKPSLLKPISIPFISQIGIISYPLYLIHQYIGLLLIHKLALILGDKSGILSVALVSIVMILAAFLISSYVEIPFNKYLRTLLLSKRLRPK